MLTINEYNDIQNDYDLLYDVPRSITIHRTPIIDPWRRYQSWKTRHKNMFGFKYVNKVISTLLRLITIPDHMNLWMPFAILRGLEIIKEHSLDTIYVSSPPNSSQVIGYLLKKFTKVKWIADLRDPIVGNIAEVHLIKPKDMLSRIELTIRKKLEELVVHNSDKVIVNTEHHRRELMEKFDIHKFHTIRNCFDEDEYSESDEGKYDKFTIAHLGSMYGLRKADILFRAIKSLEQEVDPGSLNLQVLFIGLNDGQLQQAVKDYGVDRYVRIKEMVPHKDAIEIMMRSHLLLLVKATGEGSYGQIPGKFFEYLGTKNKILCLGPRKSEVADIIYRSQAGYVIENDENELHTILREEYEYYLQGLGTSLSTPNIEEFNSRKMGRKLISLINNP